MFFQFAKTEMGSKVGAGSCGLACCLPAISCSDRTNLLPKDAATLSGSSSTQVVERCRVLDVALKAFCGARQVETLQAAKDQQPTLNDVVEHCIKVRLLLTGVNSSQGSQNGACSGGRFHPVGACSAVHAASRDVQALSSSLHTPEHGAAAFTVRPYCSIVLACAADEHGDHKEQHSEEPAPTGVAGPECEFCPKHGIAFLWLCGRTRR